MEEEPTGSEQFEEEGDGALLDGTAAILFTVENRVENLYDPHPQKRQKMRRGRRRRASICSTQSMQTTFHGFRWDLQIITDLP